MKKLKVLICLFAVLAFAGCAFAVVAGHVNPDAAIDTSQAFTYDITSADVTIEPASLDVTVESASIPESVTNPDNLLLPEATTNQVIIWTGLKVTLPEGYTEGTPITFHLANYPGTETSNLYAALRAVRTVSTASMDYQEGMYYGHEASVSNGVLTFKVDNPEAFFYNNNISGTQLDAMTLKDNPPAPLSNDVVIATAKTVSSGGGGGGCNAGFAGLLLLAAMPLLYMKKK